MLSPSLAHQDCFSGLKPCKGLCQQETAGMVQSLCLCHLWVRHSLSVPSLPPLHPPSFRHLPLSNSSQPCPGIYPAEIRLLITVFYDFLFIIALGGALCCSALICVLRNHFLRHNLLNGEGKQGLENTAMGSLAAEKCRTCLSVNPADVHATHVPSLLLLSPTHQGGQVHCAS